MSTKEKRVTISDIARISGYSKTAVSFAFNYPEKIGAEACRKILQVAKELDFTPNPLARSLSLGRHKAIGFLLPQDINATLANPYILQVIRGIGSVCQDNGYMLTLIPPLHDSIPEAVRNATVDGIITQGFFVDLGIRDVLRQRSLPVVAIDGETDSTVPSVTIDNEEAAYVQMAAVLEKGHRNIAIVTLPQTAFYSEDKPKSLTVKKRKEGYRRALREYHLSYEDCITEFQTGVSYMDGLKAARHILSSEKRPSAVVAMSDIVAIGIMRALMNEGISIGREMSIIGFDGIDECILTDPQLATISQPGVQKGVAAATLLFQTLNHEDQNSNIVMPCKFINRASLGKHI
jgi:Transcriptional regulators